jgi:EF hand
MTRQAFWIVPALAFALAAPAAAKDNENRKEKHRNKVLRESIYDDGRYDSRYGVARGDNMRFRGMDRNGDGAITRKEWQGNDKSFNQHDLNRDGVLAGREVRSGARNDAQVRRDARVRRGTDTFGRLDRNRDGVLHGSEWPYDSSAFRRIDRNRNGVIENWEYRQQ